MERLLQLVGSLMRMVPLNQVQLPTGGVMLLIIVVPSAVPLTVQDVQSHGESAVWPLILLLKDSIKARSRKALKQKLLVCLQVSMFLCVCVCMLGMPTVNKLIFVRKLFHS